MLLVRSWYGKVNQIIGLGDLVWSNISVEKLIQRINLISY